MKIVQIQDVDVREWNRCVRDSDDAWLFHDAAWIDIESRFFAERCLSFALVEGDEIVGVCPLYLAGEKQGVNGETILHSGIHRHASLALRNGLDGGAVKAGRSLALRHIFELAQAYSVDRIHQGEQTATPKQMSSRKPQLSYLIADYNFQAGMSFAPTGMDPCPGLSVSVADQIIGLEQPEQELFARLSGPCRRAIRRAEKSGLTWDIKKMSEALSAYMELAEVSALRTGEALPPIDYYEAIADMLGGSGRANVAFSYLDGRPVAGLITLIDKSVMSYLAGVSDPDALSTRCNDHVHWQMMLWARQQGAKAYRLGPWFPEVPREWPISKVSAFKTKFGAKSVPVVYASKYLNPEKYLARLPERQHELAQIGVLHSDAVGLSKNLTGDIIEHHMAILGVGCGDTLVMGAKTIADAAHVRSAIQQGRPVVAIQPSQEFLNAFNLETQLHPAKPPTVLVSPQATGKAWARLRTLHDAWCFRGPSHTDIQPIVLSEEGDVVWGWLEVGASGMLLIGTSLGEDLVLYRQGDPNAKATEADKEMWGYSGERPNFLFEKNLYGEEPHERHADWWGMALREALVSYAGIQAGPILPNGAPGVLVVTGDDDAALQEHYERQCELLAPIPITYFALEGTSALDSEFMAGLAQRFNVEWQLHPDALEAPEHYDECLAGQVEWFKGLTGENPTLVRNHGFLNDGYWGHLPAWRKSEIRGSSNLPGFDGRVLNGSLLPARLVEQGSLTDHWSLLTLIGDGIVSAGGRTPEAAGQLVRTEGKRILESGVPGVMCLNLHPVNVESTREMHEAVKDLLDEGFIAMTFTELLDWYSKQETA
jgi:Acetyltransferase (GNAT) domain